MSSTQIIRRRIKSVSSTRQITKAMELVAAAKMRKSQELTLNSRLYSNTSKEVLGVLSQLADSIHPLLSKRAIKRKLYIVITSDRGLAGSYNSAILKAASKAIEKENVPCDLITIGKKSQDYFKQTSLSIIATFAYLPPISGIKHIYPIADIAIKEYTRKYYDSVDIIYTVFESTIKQRVEIEHILPFSPANNRSNEEYTFEPSMHTLLEYIIPRLVEVQIYQALLESSASEHSSRMVAMKNASDNAKDIISLLGLEYNSLRQASITQELAEITSGAAALQ